MVALFWIFDEAAAVGGKTPSDGGISKKIKKSLA
jgi:hypothetical protein